MNSVSQNETEAGKIKNILLGSIDAALLAVEVYNKPRTTFRSQAYIVLMIIAWTRLFHAFFRKEIGDKYYYRDEKNPASYKRVNGEWKAWELNKCIDEYEKHGSLGEAVNSNLHFFIGLRNKIEHRHVGEREVDASIFGECQALLFNYESLLIEVFGSEYAINESLAFALQFSYMRTREQKQASKKVLTDELKEIQSYIESYRSNLRQEIFDSQEFSIKVIQIPKISNTNRNDLAIEFVRWDELNLNASETYQHITAIIKDKRVVREAKNVGRLKAGEVMNRVKNQTRVGFNQTHHTWLVNLFSVRPPGNAPNPECTNTEYCHYDFANQNYVYEERWVNFIVELFEVFGFTIEKIHQAYKNGEKWDIRQYS